MINAPVMDDEFGIIVARASGNVNLKRDVFLMFYGVFFDRLPRAEMRKGWEQKRMGNVI